MGMGEKSAQRRAGVDEVCAWGYRPTARRGDSNGSVGGKKRVLENTCWSSVFPKTSCHPGEKGARAGQVNG